MPVIQPASRPAAFDEGAPPQWLGEVFCKIKTKSAIKLLVLYPGKLLKIMP